MQLATAADHAGDDCALLDNRLSITSNNRSIFKCHGKWLVPKCPSFRSCTGFEITLDVKYWGAPPLVILGAAAPLLAMHQV